MTQKNKNIIKNGCVIEGAGKYFFEHSKKYPSYDVLKDEHHKVHNIEAKLKDLNR